MRCTPEDLRDSRKGLWQLYKQGLEKDPKFADAFRARQREYRHKLPDAKKAELAANTKAWRDEQKKPADGQARLKPKKNHAHRLFVVASSRLSWIASSFRRGELTLRGMASALQLTPRRYYVSLEMRHLYYITPS